MKPYQTKLRIGKTENVRRIDKKKVCSDQKTMGRKICGEIASKECLSCKVANATSKADYGIC